MCKNFIIQTYSYNNSGSGEAEANVRKADAEIEESTNVSKHSIHPLLFWHLLKTHPHRVVLPTHSIQVPILGQGQVRACIGNWLNELIDWVWVLWICLRAFVAVGNNLRQLFLLELLSSFFSEG